MEVSSLPQTDFHEWGSREKNTLVLNYTAACPLKCDFCCYGCSPSKTQKMDIAQARRLILHLADQPEFTSVGFTGGEPLLFPDEIIELAGTAKSIGKNSTIATAGHWADSFFSANAIIDSLVENGLNRLNVSYDPSHEAFVPRKNIENIIAALEARTIPLYIVSTLYDRAAFDKVVDFSEPEKGVFHLKKLVAQTGRAKPALVSYGTAKEFEGLSCYRSYYSDLVIFYDGKAYPCCSTFNRATSGLVLGNAFEEGLGAVIDRLLGGLLFRSIKRHSFAHLVSIIDRYDTQLATDMLMIDFDGGACSLCNKIFKRPDLTARIKQVMELFEIDKLAELNSKLECA